MIHLPAAAVLTLLALALLAAFTALGAWAGRRSVRPTPVPAELLLRLREAEEREAFQQRRADEFFGIIAGIEKEADEWRRIYKDSQRMAGAAQSWLLRDLNAALVRGNAYAAELRKLGHKVSDLEVDPAIVGLVEEFGKVKDAAPAPRLPIVEGAPPALPPVSPPAE